MDNVDFNRVLLGKILGEIYLLKNKSEISTIDKPRVYALCNGIEEAIDEEIESIGFISKDKFKNVVDILSKISSDPRRLALFQGFYDIEPDFKKIGVDRQDAIKILTYLNLKGDFTNIILKMDSDESPIECRTFLLTD